MRVLGIESSCDETAAALVTDTGEVLADVVASQIATHSPYGGIVPELASRAHMQAVIPVICEALERSPGGLSGVDAIAVTRGPGLVGSLLVGVQVAKALAWSLDKPLVGVNHLDGHLFAVYLRRPDQTARNAPSMPYVGLLVSGGHTALYRVEGFDDIALLAQTRDDAAGEAFDKAAKLLGLGYPGGPIIDKLAAKGEAGSVSFPMPMASRKTLDFSFSGLKTALARHVQTRGVPTGESELADLCASFQGVIIESLVRKSLLACEQEGLDQLVITGGVAANRGLRARGKEACDERGIRLHVPPPISCTDNAAMIAMAAAHRLVAGERDDLRSRSIRATQIESAASFGEMAPSSSASPMSDRVPNVIASPYVEVALPVPLRRLFTYAVPDSMRGSLGRGSRVAVSFNRRKLAGVVVSGRESLPEGVKRALAVAGLLESEPVFTPELLRFLEQAAKYYMHPLGEVLRAAAPALPTGAMKRLRADGFLEAAENLPGQRVAHHVTWEIRATEDASKDTRLGARQKKLMERLRGRDSVLLDELRSEISDPRGVVRALAEKGLVVFEEVEANPDPFFRTAVERDVPPTPTSAQQHAIDAINDAIHEQRTESFLLHGVTGSGKTEVYLRAIEEVRKAGEGAILLVPEIALTPQLVGRFRARFGDDIAVLHSGLTSRQREDAWRSLRRGGVRVAIGARSALFAPVADLRLVVVDEEHDPSFKQDEGFRYHARDMALLRAQYANAVCVLGSATPSIETYHRANDGKIRLLSLPSRATGATLPSVEIVDLRRHRRGPTGHPLLSGPLHTALGRCLGGGHQAILFLNRRGFSPSVRCEACAAVAECPACSVALTEHRGQGVLRCHYCDFHRPIAAPCAGCGANAYKQLGVGTEQLQHAIEESFPNARVARLDRDTASGEGVEVVLDRLRTGAVDVLVGTQMVTKGHDIAGVTLVGVVLADQSLAFPDFRASERTFQLLAQVAGRAGRADTPGEVVLQTFQPEHPAVRLAAQHDYERFYDEEIVNREEVGYPPFARLVTVRVHSGAEADARNATQHLADTARQHAAVRDGAVQILGPAPAPLARLRGRYHYRLLLKSTDRKLLRSVAALLASRIDQGLAPTHATLDIDPL